jgi:hypothetical protein
MADNLLKAEPEDTIEPGRAPVSGKKAIAAATGENLLKSGPKKSEPEVLDEDPLRPFRTGPDGELDVEALAAGYLELKEKFKSHISLPGEDMDDEDRRRLQAALGVPETPDGYEVSLEHALFERDPAIEKSLHEAGFSTRQVQLVYDLAAERMMPFIEEIAGELKAENDLKRLIDAFGGEDRWRETSRQILKWGRKNLPADVVDNLATSYEGVKALHRMMTGEDKPGRFMDGDNGEPARDEDLDRMIRDPRYWKDKDPAFVRKVTDGFKRLYPES